MERFREAELCERIKSRCGFWVKVLVLCLGWGGSRIFFLFIRKISCFRVVVGCVVMLVGKG